MSRPEVKWSMTRRHNMKGARTKAVDEDVVPVIFPEHMYLARLGPEAGAVQEQGKLHAWFGDEVSDIRT